MHALVTTEFNEAQRIKVKAFQDEGGICQYLGEGSMEGEETKGVRTDRAVGGGGGGCAERECAQPCLTLCNPMNYSLSGSSVHGNL